MFSVSFQAIQALATSASTDPTGFIIETAVILLVIAFAVVFGLFGIFRVKDNEVGILTKKFLGQKMPAGQIIARHNQIGIQAKTLMPGLYYRFPLIWSKKKAPIVVIGPESVGIIASIDGKPMPTGRLLGNEVECIYFQDGEAFLEGLGIKGPQVAILKPGSWRVNTELFHVSVAPATAIREEHLGVVVALDGMPLPTNLVIAPRSAKTHHFFQDGQAFLEDGFRGPQLDTIQPGRYYINPLLFKVSEQPQAEIAPGYVAVIRSNVGEELAKPVEKPTPGNVEGTGGLDDKIHSDVETLLVTGWDKRGILKDPVAPGKYNLNTLAYTAYPVPTSAIMVDWAREDRPGAASMSRPSAIPAADQSKYPYAEKTGELGKDYFKFSQLLVTTKDGFQLGVDVRMVIRILPENAAFVMARFGSVFNLIQQIVHPLIDASFRNKAGEKDALDFVKAREDLQSEALKKAKQEFELYHVEAQNLLISWIDVPSELLDTQTKKQIAVQQQTQYKEQANAAEQLIQVRAKESMADKQPLVIGAQLQVGINEDMAKAKVKTAEGDRDSARIVADGQATAIRKVGEATAAAYHAQADVIGSDRVALVTVMDKVDQGKIKITPDILMVGGGKEGDSTPPIITAYFASLLQQGGGQGGGKPAVPYEHKEEPDYVSPLLEKEPAQPAPATASTANAQPAAPTMAQVPPMPGQGPRKNRQNQGQGS